MAKQRPGPRPEPVPFTSGGQGRERAPFPWGYRPGPDIRPPRLTGAVTATVPRFAAPGTSEAAGEGPAMGTILRHLWWFRDRHYRRWRLETFGLYAPSLPHERPWWRINPGALIALLRLLPGYLTWVRRMGLLHQGSAEALWRCRLPPESAVRWQAWHLKQQVDE